MSHDETSHSIWLMPPEPMARRLRDVIGTLAATYRAPMFEPHMTLLGDLKGPPTRTHDACHEVIQGVGAIGAEIKGIETSPAYFMSLFLELSLGTDLDSVRHALSTRLRGQDAPPFRPHLSLAYGLNEDERLRAQAVGFGDDDLIFNRLAVVHSAKSVPIEDWSILSQMPL